ncbi:MAG: acetyl-CoA carboxylase carboxyltransferase subunit alpha [Lachnospiraceae bacterium]|nr:acetyl-CoA carboxylase carboxyltransferase subunit alpha [Lachnospiraceae bacterium]
MKMPNLFFKQDNTKEAPDFIVCPECGRRAERKDVAHNNYICTFCGYYYRIRTNNRIKMIADRDSFEPLFSDIPEPDPLKFEGYAEKLAAAREKTGLSEAVTVGRCTIFKEKCILGICDARFLMSSMGHVVGEKIARAFEAATKEKLPVVMFVCSGGARMQEGIISLMQMEKTAAAVKRHSEAGLLYIPVLTDPTTGGVTASFAMLGDIILAEPGALIGFAGPRVIEQTIGQRLPEGFQKAEFLRRHGFVDAVVERDDLKQMLYTLIVLNSGRALPKDEAEAPPDTEEPSYAEEEHANLSAWERVREVRSLERPSALRYIHEIFDDFTELHGDRYYADDRCIVGGIASIGERSVTVIGVEKGHDMAECMKRNFGMPSPEGYRKALRLMKQAEKFHRPIITFVNTPGAYPGVEAEENGQGEAIAKNLYEMSGLKVPVLSLMIGEGGSGGALALAVGNEVWMMENATYSILSPEGFATILWKDGKRAEEAAEVMQITADSLLKLGVIEKIIPEYGVASEFTLPKIAAFLRKNIGDFLSRYSQMSSEALREQRYVRFRKF